jgi:hypothetical protein
LASLGGLVSLKKLDMTGCRGNEKELERKIWAAIKTERTRQRKDMAE